MGEQTEVLDELNSSTRFPVLLGAVLLGIGIALAVFGVTVPAYVAFWGSGVFVGHGVLKGRLLALFKEPNHA